MSLPTVAVIVVAAGSGVRLGGPVPKAFVTVSGRTLLEWTLDQVFAIVPAPQVIVVVPDGKTSLAQQLCAETDALVIAGGPTRQQSVARGVAALGTEVATVLVHDAARALTPTTVFPRVINHVRKSGHGVVPGLPIVNTVKCVDEQERVVEDLDRSRLREIQTPQGFPRSAFEAAHRLATEEYTDDGALFAAAGHPVAVIDGDPLAFKITTPWDLRRAEQLLPTARVPENAVGVSRTGMGVDVHVLDAARPLWLGGVSWPNEPGLAGHSDGDAACHALCDALLSAAGLGDMGSRFGTDDPRFAGAAGAEFLTESVTLVKGAGFRILNATVQVVANSPKIGSRRAEIEERLSSLVGAPVSVSATTTDGLGFTGRGEGIAVFATCLVATL